MEDISMQYGLSDSEIIRSLTDTLEQYYSYRFRQPVTAELKNEAFVLRKYSPGFDGYHETEITLDKRDFRPLVHLLRETFQSLSFSLRFPCLRNFINELAEGYVDFRTPEYAVIRIRSGIAGTLLGVCAKRRIPPKERCSFTGSFRFYVTGMAIFESEPALELSRINRGLVEKLFEEQGDNVRCIHRIARAKSEVISKGHINSVSDELRERIIVRYRK